MKKRKLPILKTLSFAAIATGTMLMSGCGGTDDSTPQVAPPNNPVISFNYEVWGTDQSNTNAGAAAIGTQGSAMWIWDKKDIEAQIAGGAAAKPIGCGADANVVGKGPCKMEEIFPGTLTDENGKALSTAFGAGFARMHGSLSDPQGKYMNVNMFLTGGSGGFVGLMDANSKEAIALWQVTKTGASAGGRSVHMSFWNEDGSALFIANLHGRIMERVDISRDSDGNITNANLNRAAAFSAAAGTNAVVQEPSHAYSGKNGSGKALIGSVSGTYSAAAFGDLTPTGKCKENGKCATGVADGAAGGRPGGVIICPIVSDTGMGYLTFGAGGMLVVDTRKTPMNIVAEYGNNEVNGAGCGGVHIGKKVWLDGGISATGAGAPRSTFTVYTVDDSAIAAAANAGTVLAENTPAINTVFKDPTNTAPSGNVGGVPENLTGQVPGTTTRRDAHGMIETTDNKYVHVVDRIQNTMDVFDAATEQRVGSYDLTSADGKGNGDGPCLMASIPDAQAVSSGEPLTVNDPAPDLMGITPDGKYIVVALRGPKPVTVNHGGQGSCPGVGMIELTEGGASGKLVSVLRATNTADTAVPPNFAGGANYIGTEAADIHGATARLKR
ncbi:MAG: hypothetical protein V3U71_06535 [Cocleimonas sp.]